MRSLRKKGISPIIATVLLISFAVAIGAVAMSWKPSTNCESKVMLQALRINEKNDVCYDAAEKKIMMGIENLAKKDVDGAKITVFGRIDVYGEDVIGTIKFGEGKKVSIDYDIMRYGEVQKLKIVPLFEKGKGEYEYCTESGQEITSVEYC